VRLGLAVLGLGIMLSGCAEKSKASKRGAGAAPVIVGKAERKAVPLTLDAIGVVEPSRTASVRPQVTGTLMKIDFKEGQQVNEGDLLFEIDPRPFQNALRSAEADLQRFRVQYENAHTQSERYRALNADSAISKEQFQSIKDTERGASAQVLNGEAAVANAKLQLEYCSIRAPISGRTGSLLVREGNLVRGTTSEPLVMINRLRPILVRFAVPADNLPLIQAHLGKDIGVRAEAAGGGDPSEGALSFVDNAVDTSTGTILLKGRFPNDDGSLWPGGFVNVRLQLYVEPDALVVPAGQPPG